MKTITAGQALTLLLADYGVDTVFGIPGTHSIELYREFPITRIHHISPRHEQGGGFMADGYARTSGKPGVCFVITGPGVTNIATPMAEAYIDSIPMLVISPVNQPDPSNINRGRLHEITNQQAVSEPLCAMSITVGSATEIPKAIARAFEIFAAERPGPVHINIPLTVLTEPVREKWQVVQPPKMKTVSNSFIQEAADILSQSDQAVLVIGGGTINGQQQILKLAETLNCPVLTTIAARGVIPSDHPLSVGAQLRAPHTQGVLRDADTAMFLGTEFSQTDHWNNKPELPPKQIWVNINPDSLDTRTDAMTTAGDCIDFASRLVKLLPKPSTFSKTQIHERCRTVRSCHQQTLTEKEKLHWQILRIIGAYIPEEFTIVSDMTQLAYTAIDYMPMQRPRQWLHPTGYGPLGYALPAAIGALLSGDTDAALAIVGDAGFQYTLQEMSLAHELGLNLVVLLWNNDALQQISDDMYNAGITRIGVLPKNPDFRALASACGWNTLKVHTIESLGNDLVTALHMQGPSLVLLDEELSFKELGYISEERCSEIPDSGYKNKKPDPAPLHD